MKQAAGGGRTEYQGSGWQGRAGSRAVEVHGSGGMLAQFY